MVLVSSCLVQEAKKNDSGGMTKRTSIDEWAAKAWREAVARAVRALQSEIELELTWVKDAKARLGLP
jgi:hypothetical protein